MPGGAQENGVTLGAVQIATGLVNKAKLKKEAAELANNRPIQKTSQFDRDALALSESELANGMSAGAERAYDDATDRGLSSSISALLKGGGSVNNVGDIYANSEQGRQQLAMMQDQMRLSHIQGVLKQYDKMSDNDERNFLVNDYGPYKDKLQAIGEQRKAAAQLINSGIDTAGASLAAAFGGDTGLMSSLGGAGGKGSKIGSAMDEPFNIRSMGESFQIQPQQLLPYSQAQPLQTTINPNNNNYLSSVPANNGWQNFWNNYTMKI